MSDEQAARTILEMHGISVGVDYWGGAAMLRGPVRDCEASATDDLTRLVDAICVALNQARTPPPGHIIDDAGNVRRVLGSLPITKDGCVVGYAKQGDEAQPAFYIDGHLILEGAMACSPLAMFSDPNGLGIIEPLNGACDCYSTREAAHAAKESK